MRKISVTLFVVVVVLVFSYCSSSKKAAVTVAKVTYQANIMQLVQANCAPCHFPEKGGRKKPLDNYNSVVAQLDEVMRRIQLPSGTRGAMPDKKPRMSDSTINAFVQWKTDGLLEK